MDEPWGHYSKWNNPVTKTQILCDSTYVKYLEKLNSETERRRVVARRWREGEMGGV